MAQNGETIYGTRIGTVMPDDWGVSTLKGKKLYLHILDLDMEVLLISPFQEKIASVLYYKDKTEVPYRLDRYGLLLELPSDKRQEINTIIEITLR